MHRLPTTAINVKGRHKRETTEEVTGVRNNGCSLWGNFEHAENYGPKHRAEAVSEFGSVGSFVKTLPGNLVVAIGDSEGRAAGRQRQERTQ